MPIIIEYIGRENANGERSFIAGVPARNLTAEDLEGLGWSEDQLTATDLYQIVEQDEPDTDEPAEEE